MEHPSQSLETPEGLASPRLEIGLSESITSTSTTHGTTIRRPQTEERCSEEFRQDAQVTMHTESSVGVHGPAESTTLSAD